MVLEFENGSREEELFVVFVSQRGNFRMVGVDAQGFGANLSDARLVWFVHRQLWFVICPSCAVIPSLRFKWGMASKQEGMRPKKFLPGEL